MTQTFLLLGAQGMLGVEIFNASQECDDIEIIPFSRFNADITSAEQVEHAIAEFEINGVINTAAYTSVDRCEDTRWKSIAWEVNAKAPEYIRNACQKKNIPLYHFSTDYVFAGTAQKSFAENDPANPINEYGKSKHAGEQAILQYTKGYVLRTAWLAGESGHSFVHQILHASKTQPSVQVIENEWGSPSFCTDVVRALFSLLRETDIPNSQIFHLVNEGSASRKELVEEIHQFLGLSTPIESVTTFGLPATRPESSILRNTLLPPLPHWKDGLHALLATEKRKLDEKRVVEEKKRRGAEKYKALKE